MRGLLYPALHKFYSALSSLEKFEKGTNFFDNIAHLDNFFSEYRNVTFVLQKSLAHTQFTSDYERLRNEFLVNEVGKWFIEKRNAVLKQQPFDLEKRIVIRVYSGQETAELPELIFTIDSDVPYSTVITSLRQTFRELDPLEVMFSAEFFFFEGGHKDDLYDNFITGINQMRLFLEAIRAAINEDCKLCDELESKIKSMNFYQVPKDMLLVDDYIFYCQRGIFEKASRIALLLGLGDPRCPIENLSKINPDGDSFSKFELMHIVIYQMQRKLLPTCMVLYADDTFEFLTFGFSIKTTLYRKLHEVAKRIELDNIVNVCFVNEMYVYIRSEIQDMDSREKVKHARDEILLFTMVDKDLAIKVHEFDIKRVDDFEYVAPIMFSASARPALPGFMNPVLREFIRIKENIQ